MLTPFVLHRNGNPSRYVCEAHGRFRFVYMLPSHTHTRLKADKKDKPQRRTWPPAPRARITSTRTSSCFSRSSTPSGRDSSERGKTCRHELGTRITMLYPPTTAATVLVCTRPLASVAGTRCTRCTPLSQRNDS